jgi:hypothetical protein
VQHVGDRGRDLTDAVRVEQARRVARDLRHPESRPLKRAIGLTKTAPWAEAASHFAAGSVVADEQSSRLRAGRD